MRVTLIEQADTVWIHYVLPPDEPTCPHGPIRYLDTEDSWREGVGSVCLDCLLEKLASDDYERPTQALAQMEWERRKKSIKDTYIKLRWDVNEGITRHFEAFIEECKPFGITVEKGE